MARRLFKKEAEMNVKEIYPALLKFKFKATEIESAWTAFNNALETIGGEKIEMPLYIQICSRYHL